MTTPQQSPSAASAGTVSFGDLTVNRLGFGAMRITGEGIWGEPKDPAEARRVLLRALELDVNLIDTANSYGPEVSERLIGETLSRYPRLRATRLWDMVKARGYSGGVRTLRAHVAVVRPRARHEVFLRTDPLIGEQAQVDWAYVGDVQVLGGRRPLWLFVMVLAWSRALWGEFVIDLTVHSLLRSLARAATHFGGSLPRCDADREKNGDRSDQTSRPSPPVHFAVANATLVTPASPLAASPHR